MSRAATPAARSPSPKRPAGCAAGIRSAADRGSRSAGPAASRSETWPPDYRRASSSIPNRGIVGDIAVTDDERELLSFSENTPVIARWRLDGTGLVTTRVGEGRINGSYDPTGTMLLVTHQGDVVARFVDEPRGAVDDWYVWDPAANRVIDPLDGVRGQVVWTGSPGMLAAFFADGTAGLYDVATHSRVENSTLELLDSQITTASRSSDGSLSTSAVSTGASNDSTAPPARRSHRSSKLRESSGQSRRATTAPASPSPDSATARGSGT